MITFEIDVDVDITLCTLHDMVAVDHLVQSAAPQTSARSHSTQEKTSEIGIGRLWWQHWHYYYIINRFLFN